jgi:cytidine deaminase
MTQIRDALSEAELLTRLFDAAKGAQANAHAPYSRFPVGAALRTASGAIFAGCNVENAAYPEGTCAETGAIAAMVAAGEREITHMLVMGDGVTPLTPCGACRQRIAEFGTTETLVYGATREDHGAAMRMDDLLPHAFTAHRLAEGRLKGGQ